MGYIVGTPLEFSTIFPKREDSDFFYKKRGVGKIGKVVLFTLILSNVVFLAVCGVCLLLTYMISLSILCFTGRRSLIESNQQICNFPGRHLASQS